MFYPLLLPFAWSFDILAIYQDLPLAPAAHYDALRRTCPIPGNCILLVLLLVLSCYYSYSPYRPGPLD